MSHTTTVKLRLKDLDAVERAATTLGLELKRNQTTFRVHEGPRRCEHAIVVPNHAGAHSIGLVAVTDEKGASAGWDLQYDGWGSNGNALTSKTGANLSRVRQEYAAEVAIERAGKTLARAGFVTRREMLESGVLRLRMVQR